MLKEYIYQKWVTWRGVNSENSELLKLRVKNACMVSDTGEHKELEYTEIKNLKYTDFKIQFTWLIEF